MVMVGKGLSSDNSSAIRFGSQILRDALSPAKLPKILANMADGQAYCQPLLMLNRGATIGADASAQTLDLRTLRNILLAWVATMPFAAAVAWTVSQL
jgi:hypothetical protein